MSISPSTVKSIRHPKIKPINPIETAIRSWFELLPSELIEATALNLDVLLSSSPKRWVVYQPMVLLPSGSFGNEWQCHFRSSDPELLNELWKLLLREIGKREGKGVLTHLAVNSGIPLNKNLVEAQMGATPNTETPENILRTPNGLVMLYGDFGPSITPDAAPTIQDFSEAFWVSTKQNGITQIWAPRYTMFSRGNIKEKARLLDFHKSGGSEARCVSKKELRNFMAVDLYAGIGYFVFSYVMMGMGRVAGWELNPWSVEGLRRGAIANGWPIKVVEPGGDQTIGNEKIVVFLDDNSTAEDRLLSSDWNKTSRLPTMHVNCGLLPTSFPVWNSALRILDGDGWLHLHENVGVNDIQSRSIEIEEILSNIEAPSARTIKVKHVELVKTFAPGVWHCVFDVHILGGIEIRS